MNATTNAGCLNMKYLYRPFSSSLITLVSFVLMPQINGHNLNACHNNGLVYAQGVYTNLWETEINEKTHDFTKQ